MKFVIDFDGRHQSNNMVDALVNGEVYQPIDVTDATDGDLPEVAEYLEVNMKSDDTIIVFIPNVTFDGGTAPELYSYLCGPNFSTVVVSANL